MSIPGHIISAGSIVRSADMKSTAVKGKCLHCGRRTIERKPVLRYRYIKKEDFHMLNCIKCFTIVTSITKEGVMRQVID